MLICKNHTVIISQTELSWYVFSSKLQIMLISYYFLGKFLSLYYIISFIDPNRWHFFRNLKNTLKLFINCLNPFWEYIVHCAVFQRTDFFFKQQITRRQGKNQKSYNSKYLAKIKNKDKQKQKQKLDKRWIKK